MDILLPLPNDGIATLKPTLSLVNALESKGGSLFKIADQLVQQDISMGDVIILLAAAYDHAGVSVDGDFLLQQKPALLLTNILSALLTPITDMGAIKMGEGIAAL